jgi:CBS domain-containing protein
VRPDGRRSNDSHSGVVNVERIMTCDVVTVSPETPIKDVAELLVEHRIAGLPVCNADGVGIVSEGDILWKETGLNPKPGGLIARILDAADGDDLRVAAQNAGDALTSPAITVQPGATVAQAAKLMIDHAVNRLPVVVDGRLVGIVARSDLVRAFVRSDEAIESEISDDVLLRTLWIDPDTIAVAVAGGKVTLAGEVDNRSTAELVGAYIRRIPGVVSVTSRLTWPIDDLARRTAAAAAQLPRRL